MSQRKMQKKIRKRMRAKNIAVAKNEPSKDYYVPTSENSINNARIDNIQNQEREIEPVIGVEEVNKATEKLMRFKDGKSNLEKRIIANEQWWKGRHWEQIRSESAKSDIEPVSAWLFNCIMSKYADYMDAYPEPNILPREKNDKKEAEILTSIIPVVLEQNGFKKVYSTEAWKKLKDGSGIYGVFWDGHKLNGLGDISITNIDFLNLYWEPGITNIQDSSDVFHVSLVNNEQLESMYPQLKDKLSTKGLTVAEYLYEDTVDTEDKSVVIDWYYKKFIDGKSVLHYVKYVNSEVLFASENEIERPTKTVFENDVDAETGEEFVHEFEEETGEESMAERGWYDHGQYPFVIDTMFPVEGSLCGFSYIDVCKEPQKYIDKLDQAVLKNCLMNSIPRYFKSLNGNVNEEEFLDWEKPIVHVEGDVSEISMRRIEPPVMNNSAMVKIQDKINEMKETTGNTDVARGNVGGGVTSGSAISALQESAGKTSRSQNQMAYEAYKEVIIMVIELIRQFYDVPRQFRITGKEGFDFRSYDNSRLKPQQEDGAFGLEDGYRLPVFDVEVSAQKQNPYTKNAQNDLALELYSAGFFAPQNGDVALACLDIMDFGHKEDVTSKIEGNSTLYKENIQLKQEMLKLAGALDQLKGTTMAQSLAQAFGMQSQPGTGGEVRETTTPEGKEHPFNERAREQAQASTQVN